LSDYRGGCAKFTGQKRGRQRRAGRLPTARVSLLALCRCAGQEVKHRAGERHRCFLRNVVAGERHHPALVWAAKMALVAG